MIRILTPAATESAKTDLIAVLKLAADRSEEVAPEQLVNDCIAGGSYRVVVGKEWVAVVEARADALEVCAMVGKLPDADIDELHHWLCQIARNSVIPKLVLYGRKGWIRRLKALDWSPTLGINNELVCEVQHG